MRWIALAVAGGAMLAACGGGGGGGGTAAPPVDTTPRGTAAAFTFTVPLLVPAAGARLPRYVSPATRSMEVDVVYASEPRARTIANFSATAPGCSTSAAGLVCTVVVATHDGAQTFGLIAFDAPDGSGNPLSQATIPVPPRTGDRTDVPVTLDGIVRSVSFSLQGSFVRGVVASLPVLVTAKDAAGAIIVAPGAYTVPVVLTLGDTSGTFTLSTTSVAGPGSSVVLAYNGAASPGTTIAAAMNGSTIGSASFGFGASPGPTVPPSASPTPISSGSPTPSPTATPTPTPSPIPTATFPVTIHGVHR